MIKLTALLLAAVLAAVPALATGAGAGANAAPSATSAVAKTTDDLAARMNSGSHADVRAVTDGTQVKIVPLSVLKVGTVADAVNNIISENTDWMTTLRTDVAANDSLNTRLEAAGYSANEVVYAEAQPDGSVTVYVDDGK